MHNFGFALKPGVKNPAEFEVGPSDTAGNLKEAIRVKHELPVGVNLMKLVSNGHQLEDGRKLADYNIQNGAQVKLFRRIPLH